MAAAPALVSYSHQNLQLLQFAQWPQKPAVDYEHIILLYCILLNSWGGGMLQVECVLLHLILFPSTFFKLRFSVSILACL